MTDHDYIEAESRADGVARRVRPACSCGWQADRHHVAGGPAWGVWNGHVWQALLADDVVRERRVQAGELCGICEGREVGKPLCGTNHCENNECVRRCRWCMDELRDERD